MESTVEYCEGGHPSMSASKQMDTEITCECHNGTPSMPTLSQISFR